MRGILVSLLAVLALWAMAASAEADPSNYGIEVAEATLSTSQAGDHPDFTTVLTLKREANDELPATTSDAIFELPPGLSGNPTAVPACSLAKFISTDVNDKSNVSGCPQASQVGITEVELFNGGGVQRLSEPVYNLEPRRGEPARLGFFGANFPVVLDTRLRSESDYGLTAAAEGISSLIPLLSATTTIWAVPADESHDGQRITPYEAVHSGGAPDTPNGKRSSGLVPRPFMVNPVQCGVAQGVNVAAISYSLPMRRFEVFAPLEPNYSCGSLDFSPTLSVAPTSSRAESGVGLDLQLDFPHEGLENPALPGEDIQKRVELLLPEGVTVNPSQGAGLGACSKTQFALERFDSASGEGCPEDSKIGTVSAKSPLLAEVAEGSLFVAQPYDNPFGTLIALYMVVKVPDRGVIVKLPIRVEADPRTGRLRSVVEGIPQLPVSSFGLHFRAGARSPLVTPSRCGTYTATANFSSWGGHSSSIHPSFRIDGGLDGGACPAGASFAPGFSAGSVNNNAGAYSPFEMRFARSDGERELIRFAAMLPPGLTAKLAGVAWCSDASIESARGRSGRDEIASPSCPATSQIGRIVAGAGVGASLTYTEGKLYLSGPYRGAPLSAAAIVPAVAGPFDLGTVVTRFPVLLNPRTGVVAVDGKHADPIPRILAGIPLRVRDVRAYIDRSKFALNPTSCDPLQTTARIWGGESSGAESSISLAARFQAANCARLGFSPRLSLKLSGSAKRAGHPALRGVLRPRPGDANLAGAVLRLPHSAFLEQSHIRTICTRVQYAAKACPKGAVYGHARAFTPLLDKPLEGPVYLRSSSHSLPDLVAALHGVVDVEAVARIDSKNGGIRTTFTEVPDAPLSKVVVSMQGGNKGLIVNSTDLCAGAHRAGAELLGHNAKRRMIHPVIRAECAGKQDRPK